MKGKGAVACIRKFKQVLLVELYQRRVLALKGDDVEQYLDLLMELGYREGVVTHNMKRVSLESLRRNAELRSGSWNVLLVP